MAKAASKAVRERNPGRGLEVRSFADHFHRCGRAFSREAVVIPLEELTDAEIERLCEEPALACKEVDLPATAQA